MTILIAALSIVLLSLLTVQAVVAAVRTYKKAKGYVILKSFLHLRGTVILLIIAGIITVTSCFIFSKASKSQNAADNWKAVHSVLGSAANAERYQKLLGSEYGIEITDPVKFAEDKIAENSLSTVSYALCGTGMVLLALEIFMRVFSNVFYITESGYIARDTEEPMRITASRFDDKLVIYLNPESDRTKMLIGIKASTENMNVLSKFIDVEIESPEA